MSFTGMISFRRYMSRESSGILSQVIQNGYLRNVTLHCCFYVHLKTRYMSHQFFSKDFAKQFRSECDLYSPVEQYQYGKLRLTKIKGTDAEMPAIAQMLSEELLNHQLLRRLLFTLKNENLPAAANLFNEVTTLKNQFEAYLAREPYTARFYNERIEMLLSFSALVRSFCNDFRDQVYSQLLAYYSNLLKAVEGPVAESTSLSEITTLTDFYLKNILSYYNYFLVAWQFEANNSKKPQVTTYMADHLQALILYIEELIAGVEKTRSLLLQWEAQMMIREEQDLYN